MRIKKIIALTLSLFLYLHLVFSQEPITLNYTKVSISNILIELRDSLDVNFSFNDAKLSSHSLTVSGSFNTVDEVLNTLFKNLPYKFEKLGDVYVISEIPTSLLFNSNNTLLVDGLVTDKFTGEILPYSTVKINDELRITDFRGRFSYVAYVDDSLHINASYLGYYVYDTIVVPTEQFVCALLPSSLELDEIRIEGKTIEYVTEAGNAIGEVRLNQKMATFMPGGFNNSIYNVLKMQSGVMASREHASSLSIWGSSQGQNQTKFDGITIYSLSSFSDNFSTINPLLVKDISIYKGGFGSNQGNRVGGIIEINGIDGNYNKPSVNVYADNQAINGMVSLPVFKRSTLVLAHRRTVLSTFNNKWDNRLAQLEPDKFSTLYYLPDNKFQDLNLKFSSFLSSGDQFYITLFNSRATSNTELDFASNGVMSYSNASRIRQSGLAAYYSKLWSNAVTSNLKFSYSGYNNHSHSDTSFTQMALENTTPFAEMSENRIDEIGITLDNRFSLTEQQFVEAGIEYNHYNTLLEYSTEQIGVLNLETKLDKVSAYVRNNIHANKKLTMDIGLRLDYVLNSNKLLFQPRIRSALSLSKSLKFNVSWGIYNQFISMLSFVDANNNYQFFWNVPSQENTTILQANILGVGLSWSQNGFLINAETYLRKTEGLYRYNYLQGILLGTNGISDSYGFDIYVKKDISKHTFWCSYAFNNTEEYYTSISNVSQKPVLYNVNNEIKVAALLNFNPFFMSANYVHGFGFNNLLVAPLSTEKPYNRFDASLYYKFTIAKSKLRFGLNVLNVLNQKNYPYFSRREYEPNNSPKAYVSMASQSFSALVFVSLSY